MATIIIRRPQPERLGPEALDMSQEEPSIWDTKLPSELDGLISSEEWKQIVDKLNEFWLPLELRDQDISNKAATLCCCACCCCLCTLGLSCCGVYCYSSCAHRGLDKRKKIVRAQMKAYFDTELNPRYAARSISFAVSPTIQTFYIEIRLNKGGNGNARPRSATPTTDDEGQEEEPLLRGRDKSSTLQQQQQGASSSSASYGTTQQQDKNDPSSPPPPASAAASSPGGENDGGGLDGLD